MTKDSLADHRRAETVQLPAGGWRIDPRHALIAAAACGTGFVAMAVVVSTGHSTDFDTAGLTLWREGAERSIPHGPSWLIESVRDFTALGGWLLRNLFAIGAIVALLILNLRREAVLLTATVAGGWLVAIALKALFARPRPSIVRHLSEAGGSSFPSGHSFNAAVVYIATALALAALSSQRSLRWTVISCALALSLLIALSRVWLGVHYPSDAIAGWLGGASWAFLASALLHRPTRAIATRT